MLPVLTVLTGIYVIFASLMTCQGGIFACDGSADAASSQTSRASAFHPGGWIGRLLGSYLDGLIALLVRVIALPSVFWVLSRVKSTVPFLTSMWTRLPWRLLTGGAAIATGKTVGILFGVANIFWAVGDVERARIFEQEPGRARGDGCDNALVVSQNGNHHDLHRGTCFAGELDQRRAMSVRQFEIGDEHVGIKLGDGSNAFGIS